MKDEENLCALPTEVLLYIFTYLPGRDLVRNRRVCHRWKQVIDGMTWSEALWREHCKKDFPKVYKIARMKARIGMQWFNIYKSLSLWPMLQYARETRDEFASAGNINDEIRNFEVLENGIIAVHKRDSIVYYNIETLELSNRGAITGDYLKYAENAHLITVQSCQLHLFVIRKALHNPRHETNVTFDQIKTVLLLDKEVYFANLDNEIFVCRLDNNDLSAEFIAQTEESIMCMGFTENLQVLTFQRKIYSVINKTLIEVCLLDDCENLLQEFHRYNLLETVDWRIVFQWISLFRKPRPSGPLQDIITVKVYGETVFVGCNWGVLLIYHAPYVNGEFNFYFAEPVKVYNFLERYDCPVLTRCPIIKIDVIESEDGHIVVVGMPKKIAVLEFIHNFKRTASVALLPYSDTRKAKIFKPEKTI